ncbi:MAG: ankyrin repeat domain-containing protein, partial [Endozoicomonadaceae bacterium]|nr:ankyrin repeat domain-containing protein [Endozoicomonadaceae bacterium]
MIGPNMPAGYRKPVPVSPKNYSYNTLKNTGSPSGSQYPVAAGISANKSAVLSTQSKDNKVAMLINAAENYQLKYVKRLIQSGEIDVNATASDGNTALIAAAAKGHLEVVKFLCDHPDINVNAQKSNGSTALICAACNNHLAAVKYLVENTEANLNVKDEKGKTAFIFTVQSGKTKVLDYLLKHPNTDINVQDNDGKTPLMYAILSAVFSNNFKPEKRLFKSGLVNIHLKNKWGDTARDIVEKSSWDINISEHLLEKIRHYSDYSYNTSKNTDSPSGSQYPVAAGIPANKSAVVSTHRKDNKMKMLINAAKNNQLEDVKRLIQSGEIDVNATASNGSTVLIVAAAKGDLEVVKFLCDHPDINVNAQKSNGSTALICAACNNHLAAVKYLVENTEANLNVKDEKGKTAFIFTVQSGKTKVLDYLLKHPNTDINVQDNDGKTPLMYAILSAVFSNNFKPEKRLFKSGLVNIHLKNKWGDTARDIVEKSSWDINISEHLLEKIRHYSDYSYNTSKNTDSPSGSQYPVAAGIPANKSAVVSTHRKDNKMKMLINAAKNNQLEDVKRLIQSGEIDVNATASNGSTVLIVAAAKGDLEVVKFLCDHPDINVNA